MHLQWFTAVAAWLLVKNTDITIARAFKRLTNGPFFDDLNAILIHFRMQGNEVEDGDIILRLNKLP